MTALLGVMTGVTGLTALSGVMDVSETAPVLATMLGLAVGIDYALFILSRYRQNLAAGLLPREAAAQATGAAGSAVVFAGSRMPERFVHTGKAREVVVTGYTQSGRVVIAAATIMVAVFGAFILQDDPITKSIGLSLAVGVLADAFLVRLTLVPAVMALLGRDAWRLPRRLDRFLPNLDIEGERLAKGMA